MLTFFFFSFLGIEICLFNVYIIVMVVLFGKNIFDIFFYKFRTTVYAKKKKIQIKKKFQFLCVQPANTALLVGFFNLVKQSVDS